MYYLYVIQEDREGFVKIGKTLNVEDRLKQLQTANPATLSILYQFPYVDPGHARSAEDNLHDYFKHTRFKGEWFKFTKYMKDFFEKWDGNFEAIDTDVFEIWEDISDPVHEIFHKAINFCDYGNYPAAEYIVKEIEETLDDIRRTIPGVK